MEGFLFAFIILAILCYISGLLLTAMGNWLSTPTGSTILILIGIGTILFFLFRKITENQRKITENQKTHSPMILLVLNKFGNNIWGKRFLAKNYRISQHTIDIEDNYSKNSSEVTYWEIEGEYDYRSKDANTYAVVVDSNSFIVGISVIESSEGYRTFGSLDGKGTADIGKVENCRVGMAQYLVAGMTESGLQDALTQIVTSPPSKREMYLLHKWSTRK